MSDTKEFTIECMVDRAKHFGIVSDPAKLKAKLENEFSLEILENIAILDDDEFKEEIRYMGV